MTARTTLLLLLLATAGCALFLPVPKAPLNLPPLPRSSIVAVLDHRAELALTDEQVVALAVADAELQQKFDRLRAEGALPTQPPAAAGHGPGRGGGPQPPPGPGGTGGGPPGGGPGTKDRSPKDEKLAEALRRRPAVAQAMVEAKLDEADTAAFLKIERVFTAAQLERAREFANAYREQLFDQREAQRKR